MLHHERFIPYRTNWRAKKRTAIAPIDNLPFGTIITLDTNLQAQPYLVLEDVLRPWMFGGYGSAIKRPSSIKVTVLTPPSTVRTLAAGYKPVTFPEVY